MSKEIYIEIEGGTVLDPESVWPDGDVPKDFTVDQVARLVKSEGNLINFLRSWSMETSVDVCVTVGDQSLRIRPNEWKVE